MHGLVNRALECFLHDTYGARAWGAIAADAGVAVDGFEPMLVYDDALTEAVLAAALGHLQRDRAQLLEDFGTYLVSNPRTEPVRRLLRFGGVSFHEFLYSLDDLHDRARLALAALALPRLEPREVGNGQFRVMVQGGFAGVGHVVLGALRAMADDYGALVLLEHGGLAGGGEMVTVELLDESYAAGREFALAGKAAP